MNINFTRFRRNALEFVVEHMGLKQPGNALKVLSLHRDYLAARDARSFILPTNGEMIDGGTQCRLTLGDCKLPFEHCILEYSIDEKFYKNAEAGKFVPSATVLRAKQLDDGRIVATVIWQHSSGYWYPYPYGFCIDANTEIEVLADRSVLTKKVMVLAAGSDFVESIPMEQVVLDLCDEMRALAHFVLLSNCNNVKPERVFGPSPALEKRSRERGKLPPDEYYILDCFLGEHEDRTPSKSGTHISPRLHVRRGHVRRLQTGTLTWVRQCTVGNASLGRIEKDYRVRVS